MENKVLVVDDDQAIRDMLTEAFGRAGYLVTTAGSGEDALQTLAGDNIPVIFLDLMLPGIDGMEVCRKIRSGNPIAYVYAITGHPSLFQLADCREAGFDDYFLKPMDLSALFRATEQAFEKFDRWKKR